MFKVFINKASLKILFAKKIHGGSIQLMRLLVTSVFLLQQVFSMPTIGLAENAPVAEQAVEQQNQPEIPAQQATTTQPMQAIPANATTDFLAGSQNAPLSQASATANDDPAALLHLSNPIMQTEALAVFDLMKDADATVRVTQDSRWSDLHIREGDRIVIAQGVTVTIDDVFNDVTAYWIRVDGALKFKTDVNTGIRVDTIIVTTTGKFEMGSETEAIAADVEAKVIFQGKTDIDRAWDPLGFSRGLISHGEVSIRGANKTGYATVTEALKGQQSITLSSVPADWRKNDKLVLSGFEYGQHEELTLDRIEGSTVYFKEALKFDHKLPEGYVDAEKAFEFHLVNVSRNAVLESEALGILDANGKYDPDRMAHVMFMHSDKVSVQYASSYNGRTDKLRPLIPSEVINGVLKSGTGENVSGRYAWNFYKTGIDTALPALIKGSVAMGSQGWGFVNHNSNVAMDSNIAYNVVGAGFVEATGVGVGVMQNNLAIHSIGSGFGLYEHALVTGIREQSYGHEGYGFWFQGSGMKAINNIALNQAGHGMMFFTYTVNQVFTQLSKLDFLTREEKERIAGINPSLPEKERDRLLENARINVSDIPFLVDGLISYGNKAGGYVFETWHHQMSARHNVNSVVRNVYAWVLKKDYAWGGGFYNPLTRNVTFENIHLMSNKFDPNIGTAMIHQINTENFTYRNIRVEGFMEGITIPLAGTNKIINSYFNNLKSIVISSATAKNRRISLEGNTFGTLVLKSPKQQFDIWMKSNFNPKDADISRLFENPDVITGKGDSISFVAANGEEKQLYYTEQGRDYVLNSASLPDEIRGKTNAQIWAEFGLAVGATLPPLDAVAVPRINGLVGSKAVYLPSMVILSPRFTTQTSDYTLQLQEVPNNDQTAIAAVAPVILEDNDVTPQPTAEATDKEQPAIIAVAPVVLEDNDVAPQPTAEATDKEQPAIIAVAPVVLEDNDVAPQPTAEATDKEQPAITAVAPVTLDVVPQLQTEATANDQPAIIAVAPVTLDVVPQLQQDATNKDQFTLPPVTLKSNAWNFIKYRDSQGNLRTTMVYSDQEPPTFEWNEFPDQIHPEDVLDVNAGKVQLIASGTIRDRIGNLVASNSMNVNLTNLKVENGVVKISFTIEDRAGNKAIITRDLIVSAAAPRLTHTVKGYAPKATPRNLSPLIMSLLGFKPLRMLMPLMW